MQKNDEERLNELVENMVEFKNVDINELINDVVLAIQKNSGLLGAAAIFYMVHRNDFNNFFKLLAFNGIS